MTNKETHSTLDIPDAAINQKGRGISAVWVIPIIATLIAGWLVFKSATEKKPIIDVTFKSDYGVNS